MGQKSAWAAGEFWTIASKTEHCWNEMAATRSTARPQGSLRLIGGGVPHAPSDAELTAGLRARDPDSERRVWTQFFPLVRGLLRRSLSNSSDVEDLTQEVFLRLFGAVQRLNDPSLLRSFIVGITIRVIRTEQRKQRVRAILSFQLWEVTYDLSSPPPDAGLSAVHRLERILDRLGSETRLLFLLRYVEQLELSEIEASLGWSRSTLKRRLKRAAEMVFEAGRRDAELAPYLEGFEKGEP